MISMLCKYNCKYKDNFKYIADISPNYCIEKPIDRHLI